MSRVVEIVFSVIGIVLFLVVSLGSGFVLALPQDNQDVINGFQQALDESNITNISASEMASTINDGALYILIVTLICAILGIVSIIYLKGNKKPKLAGGILIVTAILGTVATFILGIFGGIAYLIAGIIALVRKSKKVETSRTY
ncbi:DUF4064 domain-containing protein [Priestia endophytica]|jgi:hypothetical protein|uniref:DUF4064 domain-containing protein n=2 Tax=Priestia endophytica TaxID=135735 RepID=A0AAX1QAD8_9BACI|nr:DUF4064 domain-containing protein [Priestia endophytica]KAB2495231.1 DUF4064 domain-containing protein [Priestia endophytica]KYG26271.1 hypothetical protein AZF06_17255 [Priestia endophytica]MBG9813893.1 hypothetical protein [Priestia endophytica]MCM3537709.1 DUF4064 domain-containing protein [Priestia endophytica]RAS72881.1 hypothetical protein A4U60_25255 [Priestia endophytica]